jgi:hypothetical protein
MNWRSNWLRYPDSSQNQHKVLRPTIKPPSGGFFYAYTNHVRGHAAYGNARQGARGCFSLYTKDEIVMQAMTQQPGENPLPDAGPLDGIAPTPPSLVVRVQTNEPLSSEHSAPSADSADVERLRRVSALSRAICRLGAAP